MLKKLLELFIKTNGRKPNKLEWLQLKFKANQQSGKGQVIEFPQSAITDWRKSRPTTGKKADVVSSGISRKTKNLDVEDMSRAEKDEILNNWLAGADRVYGRFVNETLVKVQNASKDEQLKIAKDIINRKGMYRNLDDQDAAKILKSIDQNIKPVEPKAGGGLAGMLGEPTYQDDSHRVPYGGGGAGKPPVTFTLQGGGSYGSNKIGPGLDLTQSGYGFDLGTEIGLPWGFSATGGVGIGRGKTEVDYNDQNVFSGVGETKLGDKWNVGLKWKKQFNEGGRVPFVKGKLADPGYFMFQDLDEDKPGRYEYNPGDPRVKGEMERIKKELIKQGIIERKLFSEADRMPASNPYFLEFMEEENLGTGAGEATLEELEEIKRNLRLKQEVKDGGRIGFKVGGKGKALEGLAKLFNEFFPGTTKLGKRSKPFPGKIQEKMDLRKALTGFLEREKAAKSKKLIDEDIKIRAKELDLDEGYLRSTQKTHIEDKAGVGSLEGFTADFNKELGLNVSKEVLRHPWRMKRSYPFSTPIVDKKGKYIGDEATQQMYPKSKKFIVKDSDELTKEIDFMRGENKITAHSGDVAKAGEGRFTKAEVLKQMFENTVKQSKSAKDKKMFTNFMKEIESKPELANDPKVWNFFTGNLPKNQKLVVYGDDTVDFWRQSEFGPHNIKTTEKFIKKHPHLTKDQAVKIQNMEPEDQIFEMKKIEALRKKNMHATGGLAGMLGE